VTHNVTQRALCQDNMCSARTVALFLSERHPRLAPTCLAIASMACNASWQPPNDGDAPATLLIPNQPLTQAFVTS